jgi:HEAT repeat protein
LQGVSSINQLRKTGLVLGLGIAIFSLAGFGPRRAATPASRNTEALTRHIAVLKTGTSQDKAAAAYWLGQQKAAAASAVDPLVALLGDSSEVNPAQYRSRTILEKMTVGEEAAAALVNIGHPAIEPLIRVLKTSPEPEARKNAAWALGALHDTGATQI